MDEYKETVIHISTFFFCFLFHIYRLLLSILSTCSLLPLQVVVYYIETGRGELELPKNMKKKKKEK